MEEVLTESIPIEDIIGFYYKLNENNGTNWFVIGSFGDDGYFERYDNVLTAARSNIKYPDLLYYDLATIKANDNVKNIRLSYRTYGNDNIVLLQFSSYEAMQRFNNSSSNNNINNINNINKFRTGYFVNCSANTKQLYTYEFSKNKNENDQSKTDYHIKLIFNNDCYYFSNRISLNMKDKELNLSYTGISTYAMFLIYCNNINNTFNLVPYTVFMNSSSYQYQYEYTIAFIFIWNYLNTANPVIDARKVIETDNGESQQGQITDYESIIYTINTDVYEDGFIAGTPEYFGQIQGAGINRERLLPFFPINLTNDTTASISLHAKATDGTKSNWLSVAYYDENFNCLSRPTPISDNTETNSVEKDYTFNVPNNTNIRYFRISYRSFGNDDQITSIALTCKSSQLINTIPYTFSYLKRIIDKYENTITQNTYDKLVTNNIKTINHQGWYQCPRNTLPSYVMSKKMGFWACESDIRFTSDGVPVLLHDDTINSRARLTDGSELLESVYINSITLEQAKSYDFGLYLNTKYAGVKIPTFEEWLELCRKLNIHMYIELKIGTQTQIENLVYLCKKWGMIRNCTWISFSDAFLNYILAVDPYARCGNLSMELTTGKIDWAAANKTDKNDLFTETAINTVTDELVEYAISKDVPIEVFSANSSNILTSSLYITGYTTDTNIATNTFLDNVYDQYING